MAIAIVNKKQTAGAAAHPTLPITAATASNLLVMFIAQTGSVAAPTSAGFTVDAAEGHHAIGNTSSGSLWLATKVAAGGENELVVTPAAGGAIQGISYFELSGASTTIDAIVKVDNPGSVKTLASGALTTTDAGDVILAAVGLTIAFPSGTISAWTGTGPMTNVEATTTRCIGGSYIPGTTLTGVTFTANWETARQAAMLVVAIKPEAAGGTVTIPLNAAAATSSASITLTSTNTVPLAAAAAVSAASLAMTVNTTVPLQPAAAASAAALAMTTQTRVPLSPAVSVSAAALTVTALTVIPLQAANATSAASCTVTLAGAVLTTIPLNPAAATSSASLNVTANTRIPLNAASSTSSATCAVTLSLVPTEPVYASAGHSLLVYASAGARPLIYAKGAVSL